MSLTGIFTTILAVLIGFLLGTLLGTDGVILLLVAFIAWRVDEIANKRRA